MNRTPRTTPGCNHPAIRLTIGGLICPGGPMGCGTRFPLDPTTEAGAVILAVYKYAQASILALGHDLEHAQAGLSRLGLHPCEACGDWLKPGPELYTKTEPRHRNDPTPIVTLALCAPCMVDRMHDEDDPTYDDEPDGLNNQESAARWISRYRLDSEAHRSRLPWPAWILERVKKENHERAST